MNIRTGDSGPGMITDLTGRLATGEPLSDRERRTLATATDILALGMAADEVRRQRHGSVTTFVRVANVTIEAAGTAPPRAAGEIRLTGEPASRDQLLAAVRTARRAAGDRPVTGCSLPDLETLAAREGVSLSSLLVDLRDAGLELIARAPIDRLSDAFVDVIRAAGLPVARLTLEEDPGERRLDVLQRVARLDNTAGTIKAFAPLPQRVDPAVPTTGYDDVKMVALARLVVENIGVIQVDWGLYGPKLAQVALTFGADDLDNVSPLEPLDLGARRAPLEEIRRNIRAASMEPVERNGRFEVMAR
ncbi:MAG: hypothetical protein HYX76_07455 [Acidobacteria bacterium]|nr:hypothetical protein [Acidobacteriota bacterium]